MATLKFDAGLTFIRRLCEAIGLDPDERHVRRIVLDVQPDGITKIYVQKYLTIGEAAQVADIVKEAADTPSIITLYDVDGVAVSERGEVKVKPCLT